jgi:hypothetical protein
MSFGNRILLYTVSIILLGFLMRDSMLFFLTAAAIVGTCEIAVRLVTKHNDKIR